MHSFLPNSFISIPGLINIYISVKCKLNNHLVKVTFCHLEISFYPRITLNLRYHKLMLLNSKLFTHSTTNLTNNLIVNHVVQTIFNHFQLDCAYYTMPLRLDAHTGCCPVKTNFLHVCRFSVELTMRN